MSDLANRFDPISWTYLITYVVGLIVFIPIIARWSRKGNNILAAFGGPIPYAVLLFAGMLLASAIYDSFARGFFLASAILFVVPVAIALVVIIRTVRNRRRHPHARGNGK
jgi:hypothetical protein